MEKQANKCFAIRADSGNGDSENRSGYRLRRLLCLVDFLWNFVIFNFDIREIWQDFTPLDMATVAPLLIVEGLAIIFGTTLLGRSWGLGFWLCWPGFALAVLIPLEQLHFYCEFSATWEAYRSNRLHKFPKWKRKLIEVLRECVVPPKY